MKTFLAFALGGIAGYYLSLNSGWLRLVCMAVQQQGLYQ
jgi:hypothetical protein